jgi:hypothetical protein
MAWRKTKDADPIDGGWVLNLDFQEPYVIRECISKLTNAGFTTCFKLKPDGASGFLVPAETRAEAELLVRDWFKSYGGSDVYQTIEAALADLNRTKLSQLRSHR